MSEWIAHSRGPWKEHKYLRKEGEGDKSRYIYSETSVSPKNGFFISNDDFKISNEAFEKAQRSIDDFREQYLFKKFPEFEKWWKEWWTKPIVEIIHDTLHDPLYPKNIVAGDFKYLSR